MRTNTLLWTVQDDQPISKLNRADRFSVKSFSLRYVCALLFLLFYSIIETDWPLSFISVLLSSLWVLLFVQFDMLNKPFFSSRNRILSYAFVQSVHHVRSANDAIEWKKRGKKRRTTSYTPKLLKAMRTHIFSKSWLNHLAYIDTKQCSIVHCQSELLVFALIHVFLLLLYRFRIRQYWPVISFYT